MTDQKLTGSPANLRLPRAVAFIIPFTLLSLGHADALLAIHFEMIEGRERLVWGIALLAWAAVGLLLRSVAASIGEKRNGRLFMATCAFSFFSGVLPVLDPDAIFAVVEAVIAVAIITSICVELLYGFGNDLPQAASMAAIAQAAGMLGVLFAGNITVSLLLSFASFIAIMVLYAYAAFGTARE